MSGLSADDLKTVEKSVREGLKEGVSASRPLLETPVARLLSFC